MNLRVQKHPTYLLNNQLRNNLSSLKAYSNHKNNKSCETIFDIKKHSIK